MANYIKIVTAVPTATTAETFFLVSTENLLQGVATSTTNLRFYYGPMSRGEDNSYSLFAIDITIGTATAQATLNALAANAMQAAAQNPGSCPYLIPYGPNGGAPTLATAEDRTGVNL